MLLLIAVANVPVWTGTSLAGGALPDYERMSAADSAWVIVRTLLVDHRAYPLFAMLFGFGLMTMINRRVASGTRSYLESVTGGRVELASPAQEAWAREQATVDARRLVRRRGWWMVLFGAVHGVFFYGDIIGTYGLIAVLFAGWLARKHRKRAIAACVIVLLWAMMSSLGQASLQGQGDQQPFGESGLPWVVLNPLLWLFVTIFVFTSTMAIPAVFIGARLADTDLLSHPERHRGLLLAVGLGGLGLGALGGLHAGLVYGGWAQPRITDIMVAELTGLLGACGWLALLALYAGGPRPDGGLSGLRWVASAVGRRSMTAYLTQTILFGLIFAVVPWLLVVSLRPGDAVAAVVAVGVWLVTVVLCVALERSGRPGPFETLLRTAVARSARRRREPAGPAGPASSPTSTV